VSFFSSHVFSSRGGVTHVYISSSYFRCSAFFWVLLMLVIASCVVAIGLCFLGLFAAGFYWLLVFLLLDFISLSSPTGGSL